MKVNVFLTVAAVFICAIVGLLFGVFGFGTLNIVATELVILPAMILLMGISYGEGERVSMLMKTVASVVLPVAFLANILMGVFNAGVSAYIIVDGVLLISLAIGSYLLTRINQ